MFHAKNYQKLFTVVMSFLMGLTLSLIFLILDGSAGQAESIAGLLADWLVRFMQTWVIVLPVVLLISPLAKRIVGALVRSS